MYGYSLGSYGRTGLTQYLLKSLVLERKVDDLRASAARRRHPLDHRLQLWVASKCTTPPVARSNRSEEGHLHSVPARYVARQTVCLVFPTAEGFGLVESAEKVGDLAVALGEGVWVCVLWQGSLQGSCGGMGKVKFSHTYSSHFSIMVNPLNSCRAYIFG